MAYFWVKLMREAVDDADKIEPFLKAIRFSELSEDDLRLMIIFLLGIIRGGK